MSKRNPVKSGRSSAKPKKSAASPKKSPEIQSNLAAVEDVISWLYQRDALGKVDSATVAIARTLASTLDDPDQRKNARLWKEYRETLSVLIKAGEERKNEFDDVLRGLEASLRDNPAR